MMHKTRLSLIFIQVVYFLTGCDSKDPKPIRINLEVNNKQATCDVKTKELNFLENETASIIVEKRSFSANKFQVAGSIKKLKFKSRSAQFAEAFLDKIPGGSWNLTFYLLKNIPDSTIQPQTTIGFDTYTYICCTFRVHVKKNNILSISINNNKLNTSLSDLSTEYDAVATYEYYPSEMVTISCSKVDERETGGSITLSYKRWVVQSKKKKNIATFRANLRAESNNSYIQCGYYPNNGNDWSRVRVYLLLKDPKGPTDDIELSIRVNGLKYRSTDLSSVTVFNETLNIDCERNDNSLGSFYWDYENSNCVIDNKTESTAVTNAKKIRITCPPSNKNFELTCIFATDGNKVATTLVIQPDTQQWYYISGLQDDKVLFIKDEGFLTEMDYEYAGSEMLHLACKKNKAIDAAASVIKTDVMWTSEPKGYESANNEMSILLNDTTNNTKVMCTIKEQPDDHRTSTPTTLKEIKINLVQADTLNDEAIHATEVLETADTQGSASLGDVEDNNWLTNMYIIGVIAASCIVVVIICTALVVRSKHNERQIKRDSNIDYENLPPTTSNSTPHPVQWDEDHYAQPVDMREDRDTYSVPYKPKLEDLYSKPTKKKKMDVTDVTYAEVGCSSNYSQVLPKSQRNPPPNDHYAELVLKVKDKNHEYVNQIADESPYAEIAQYQDKKYVNLFPNSRYGNTNQNSEYAEPAYCEVSKLHNK